MAKDLKTSSQLKSELESIDLGSDFNRGVMGLVIAGVCFVSLPLAVLVLVSNEIDIKLTEGQKLEDITMSDEWLENIANRNDVSKKGLNFLNKKVHSKGHVNGKDAKKFLEIEEEESKKQKLGISITDKLGKEGALALQSKVDELSILTKGKEAMSDTVDSVSNFASDMSSSVIDKAEEGIDSISKGTDIAKDALSSTTDKLKGVFNPFGKK